MADEDVPEDLGKPKGGAAEVDFDNELQNNTSAFEALERDFQEVGHLPQRQLCWFLSLL